MKNNKLQLKDLVVKSFVTDSPIKNENTIKGGLAERIGIIGVGDITYAGNLCDTNKRTCGECDTDPFCSFDDCKIDEVLF